MAFLVNSGKCGAINIAYTSKNGFYLSCSYHNHIYYKITQELTENYNFWIISCESTIYLLNNRNDVQTSAPTLLTVTL